MLPESAAMLRYTHIVCFVFTPFHIKLIDFVTVAVFLLTSLPRQTELYHNLMFF